MNVGDAFVNINSASPNHLWVVIARVGPKAAIVNLTTLRASTLDHACLIEPGDHPFVDHQSVVNYKAGQMLADSQLNLWAARGILIRHEPVSQGLLRRIQEGALVSDFTPQKIQAAAQAALE